MEKASPKRYSFAELNEILGLVAPTSFACEKKSSPVASVPSKPAKDAVGVYVRIRPLLQSEIDSGAKVIVTSAKPSCCDEANVGDVEINDDSCKSVIGGFSGVSGCECQNRDVFCLCLQPRLETVISGGTVSFFCYGYTGGGKTHTVLGYDGEPGMYALATEELLNKLSSSEHESVAQSNELFICATACEVYSDKVYDLLGESRVECVLRMDEGGKLQIRGPAEKSELESLFPDLDLAKDSGPEAHATIVTRSSGLTGIQVRKAADLWAISNTAIQQRAVGHSSEHKQSSRSHAILRMEIVNQQLLDARDELESCQALIPAIRNALDNLQRAYWTELVDTNSWNRVEKTACLVEYEDTTEWDRRKLSIDARRPPLVEALRTAEEDVRRAADTLTKVSSACAALGGTLLMVDLAGADRDHRDVTPATTTCTQREPTTSDTTVVPCPGVSGEEPPAPPSAVSNATSTSLQERKESADINKSLLALKECLRAIAGEAGNVRRPPFRDSNLTRLLEDALCPRGDSVRTNMQSNSVMLVNVCPSDKLRHMTVNTLRYGQLFSTATKNGKSSNGTTKKADSSNSRVVRNKPWLNKQKSEGVKDKELASDVI